jgi:hypothetical protein
MTTIKLNAEKKNSDRKINLKHFIETKTVKPKKNG